MVRIESKFKKIIDLINQRSPLQKKRLQQYLAAQDEEFWRLAEEFTLSYEKLLNFEGLDVEYLVSAYLNLCKNMLKEQVRFLKTGKYSASSQGAYENIYLNKAEMMSYMCGLALSQFLWRNHYAIYQFFCWHISRYSSAIASYLEAGPGHGLFLIEALRKTQCRRYEVVEISPVSIEITKRSIRLMADKMDMINFREMNIFDYNVSGTKFDFITIGEVIEHVEDPAALLKKIKSLLSDDGKVFMTTCSNCPAIDHVYLFNDIAEIRDMIHSCGFQIEEELVLPVEDMSSSEIQNYRVGYNYAGMLK
ncbi:MAG: hypothetical protein AMJ78_01780 [Omnitrophica WOR_2 bacterium SM23_29]|nr:MAG: hypothetical protein AMJ78_01780 [Omnitrophica WOR_2 bacterium SM23_29]